MTTYRRRHAPRVRAALTEHTKDAEIYVLRRPKHANELLEHLTPAATR